MVLGSEPKKKATVPPRQGARRFVERPPALPLPPSTVERNIRTRGMYQNKINITNRCKH